MINEKRLVDLFLNLVTIDSETKKERHMADRLKQELENLGLEVSEDNAGEKFGGTAGNIIGYLKGNTVGKSLMLSAHMDRVAPGEGIEPILKDGIVTSKGDTILAADDIAGVAAILEALQVVKENNLQHADIKILFTVAEEGGLHGAKNLAVEEINVDFGVCYDSGGDVGTIVVEGPAQYRFQAVIHGKAAHAGLNPAAGVNAIKAASIAISEMNLGQIDHETTANIGVINGGRATNIVPDRVELLGETRSRNRDKLEVQIAHMRDITERATAKFGATCEIDTKLMYPSFTFKPDDQLVQLAITAAESIGLKTNLVASGGGSDANILNGYGIPTINLGIGMQKVHSTDEFIKVKDLIKTAEYTVAMIKSIIE